MTLFTRVTMKKPEWWGDLDPPCKLLSIAVVTVIGWVSFVWFLLEPLKRFMDP